MQIEILKQLYREKFGIECIETIQLVPAGGARKYYRLRNGDSTAVGAYNNDTRENKAFLGFTQHFLKSGLSVPEIYRISPDEKYYLLEDLGDMTLKGLTDSYRKGIEFPSEIIPWYRKVIDSLIHFQTKGHLGLNMELCFPRDEFDSRSVLWDLNHFKYFFIKLSGIPYDEDKLEDDFQKLAGKLDRQERDSFLFRDFQSRNIMIKNDRLYFIDYQGGRKGALQYDIATLLYEAKANIPDNIRTELLEYYLEKISQLKKEEFNRKNFLEAYPLFALIRQLQALGAYGLRGWIEKRPLFLQSIPFALQNLKHFSENESSALNEYPELHRLISVMSNDPKLNKSVPVKEEKLTVRISSFSYRKNIPDDITGEGGGFVFDCRGIHNPGRYERFKDLTGLDKKTKKFFEEKTDMEDFLKDAFSLIDRTVKTYIERGFKHLQVNFGCTGGQHRSVYAAQKLAEHLEHNRLLTVLVEHRELNDRNDRL